MNKLVLGACLLSSGGCATLKEMESGERTWREDIDAKKAHYTDTARKIQRSVAQQCKLLILTEDQPSPHGDFSSKSFLGETIVIDFNTYGATECAKDALTDALAQYTEMKDCEGRVFQTKYEPFNEYAPEYTVMRIECDLPENPNNIL